MKDEAQTSQETQAIAMDFDYIVKNKDKLVEEARKRAKYEVPVTVRDMEHFVKVVQYLTDNISADRADWGFTTLTITEMVQNNGPCNSSVVVFKDMGEFDAEAVGMYLSMI